MSSRRIRHHVNPLSFREEPSPLDWATVFQNPNLPLEVDVGAAKGYFMLERARSSPDVNIIGLEIRKPMVERIQGAIQKEGLRNAAALCCNANRSLTTIFKGASLSRLYVHFPDPWFKKRHHKRRIMSPEFIVEIAQVLAIGGEFHFATDFSEYAEEVLAMMSRCRDFSAAERWAAPFGIMTERERVHSSRGDPIFRYRFVLERRETSPGELRLPETWAPSGLISVDGP